MSHSITDPPTTPAPSHPTARRGLAGLLDRPEALGLAIYAVCLVVILVLYHFQEGRP